MTKRHMSAGLLGDAGDSSNMATITNPDGTIISVPVEAVGDLFAGDDGDLEGDDDSYDIQGDMKTLLGDDHITNIGDIFSGDAKKLNPSKLFASGLPTGGKKLSNVAKSAAIALRSIPGAITATKSISPVIISNGMINNAPTRNMVPGANFVETIRRYETQYPGRTRTQSNTTTNSADLTFTFAAPAAGEGGDTLYAPVILIAIATQRNFQVANVELRLSITGKNEAGTNVDSRQWTVLLSDLDKSCFFAFIPFQEISSTVFPCIVQANGTNNLVVHVYSVPASTNVRVVLPGPDSSQYQLFKEQMGISRPTTKAMDLTIQR